MYRFESALFFANADYFAARLHQLVAKAPHPVRWLILDLVSMDDIDYTGGLTLATTLQGFHAQGLTVALAQTEDVEDQLERLGIIDHIGKDHMFDSTAAAMAAYLRDRGESKAGLNGNADGSPMVAKNTDAPSPKSSDHGLRRPRFKPLCRGRSGE